MKLLGLPAILAAAAFCGTASGAPLYRWIDPQGIPHVTSEPPSLGVAYKQIEIPDTVRWSSPPDMPGEIVDGEKLSAQNLFKIASRSIYAILRKHPDGTAGDGAVHFGSAVAITDKLAITNCHIIGNVDEEFYIRSNADQTLERLQLAAADFLQDRCVVEVRSMDLAPIAGVRRFDGLEIGEPLYAIGNPARLDRTLSDGLLSAKRELEDRRFVQTTAPISPGSSGGGLFDARGNLVGITSFTLKGAQNVNFAIPAEDFWR